MTIDVDALPEYEPTIRTCQHAPSDDAARIADNLNQYGEDVRSPEATERFYRDAAARWKQEPDAIEQLLANCGRMHSEKAELRKQLAARDQELERLRVTHAEFSRFVQEATDMRRERDQARAALAFLQSEIAWERHYHACYHCQKGQPYQGTVYTCDEGVGLHRAYHALATATPPVAAQEDGR